MISTEAVVVTYGWPWRRIRALRGFTWQVPSGKTLLLGPNGAGKSTLLKVLCGIVRPSAGRAVGLRPRHVGYMPQVVRPVQGLSVCEQVAYCGWLAGMPRRAAQTRAREALVEVGLDDMCGRPSGALSGGQLRRLGLAEALVSDAELLVLDEPGAGLDPTQRQNLGTLIARLSQELVVASHQIEDIDTTYDHVAVALDGRLRFTGSVDEFLACDPSGADDPYQAYAALTLGGRDAE